ncbi:MAG: bacteriohemerythrin [Desulfobulbaceae bacterium]|nr:bacteriohemerythrin [Desulfobulbaceae bacterium]
MDLPFIEWSPELATGIDWQDKQHQALLSSFFKLHQAIEGRKSRKQVANTLEFLEKYVEIHFAEEEKQMRQSGYPDLERHVKEHSYFTNRLDKLRAMTTDTKKLLLGIRLHQDLYTWIINHIKVSDKKLAEHLPR